MVSFPIFACANKLPKACDGGGARNGKTLRCHCAGLTPRLHLALSSRAKRSVVEGSRKVILKGCATGSLDFALDDDEDSRRCSRISSIISIPLSSGLGTMSGR